MSAQYQDGDTERPGARPTLVVDKSAHKRLDDLAREVRQIDIVIRGDGNEKRGLAEQVHDIKDSLDAGFANMKRAIEAANATPAWVTATMAVFFICASVAAVVWALKGMGKV